MILVLGSTGFLGRRVMKALSERGLEAVGASLSQGVDLRDCRQTLELFESVRPEFVLNCAAFVGGIQFGLKHEAELFTNNMLMTISVLEAAHKAGVHRLVNPISNCAYPARATFFRETEFWDGPLHESVLVYGMTRKMSCVGGWAYGRQHGVDVLNLVLSNMYGPEDHFEEERSHALGALIRKFVDAKHEGRPSVVVWGSGAPVREWLHVDDGAEALIRGIAAPHSAEPVNVGVGKGISILDLATMIRDAAGYTGRIDLDPSKPDGAPYKTVDGSHGEALLSWRVDRDFRESVSDTVNWYEQNRNSYVGCH